MMPPAEKQRPDGLVWFDAQPEEPGYYWFTGTYEVDGTSGSSDVSLFSVCKSGQIQVDMDGYMADFEHEFPPTFKGWWAKMVVPEFKGDDK